MAIGSPLTEQDLEGIRSQLTTLDELDSELKKARDAGIDVSQQMEQARKSREQLIRLRNTYFPGQV